jgi:hypothetical protein
MLAGLQQSAKLLTTIARDGVAAARSTGETGKAKCNGSTPDSSDLKVPNLPTLHPTYGKSKCQDDFDDMKLFLEAAETCFRSVNLQTQFYLYKLAAMVSRPCRRWIEQNLYDHDMKPKYDFKECRARLIAEFKHSHTREESVWRLNRFEWDHKETIQQNARRYQELMDDAGEAEDDKSRVSALMFLLPKRLYSTMQRFKIEQERRILAGKRASMTVRELSQMAAALDRNDVVSKIFNRSDKAAAAESDSTAATGRANGKNKKGSGESAQPPQPHSRAKSEQPS